MCRALGSMHDLSFQPWKGEGWRLEDQKFKVLLSYVRNSRLACVRPSTRQKRWKKKKEKQKAACPVWWHKPVMAALGRRRQGDRKSKVSTAS